jgi:ABC-2 type transport system permease protein
MRFPSVDDEARTFWRLRRRIFGNLVAQACTAAWVRLVLVMALSLMLWGVLFLLSRDAFHFLQSTVPSRELYEQIVRAIFGMFFASLMVMLVFSAGIILYASLFHSPETRFLLTQPVRVERVYFHKFQESLLLSSWGFLLLGSPVLVAYGLVARAPWYYFVLLFPSMAAFVYIPAAIGGICCLLVTHRLTNRRGAVTAVAGLVAIAAAIVCGWWLFGRNTSNLLTPLWFQEMLGRLQLTEQRLLPSWWLSAGLLEAARGQGSESLLFLVLLVSNALFFQQLSLWVAGQSFRPAYSALHGAGNRRRSKRTTRLDRLIVSLCRVLPLHMRLLMIKDLRLFRRDPVQWSQLLIFLGLLALYFVNIRRFTAGVHYAGWINMVSFLNLAVVGLLLSTFNTRFIFPLISLEGRRFWILGLLPLTRPTILWSKFWFGAIGCAVPSALLVLLSDVMLGVPISVIAAHQLACLLLSSGLSGIAVGLGAAFPQLREQSPARIAAGNGGTLNLVLSTGYILLIVLFTAVPCHFYYAVHQANLVTPPAHVRWYFHVSLLGGTAASVLLAAVATLVPMRIGFRAFQRMEF